MTQTIDTQCCIVGGGPAGMMLGFLLARAGVDVVVLEKHRDFLRDFRGDTVHPSTLTLFDELGLLEQFLELPHQKVERLGAHVGDNFVQIADFSRLNVPAPFIAMTPQWTFLNFIAQQARRFPGFRVMMQTEAVDLIRDAGRITGVEAHTAQDQLHLRAPLTVACDGRGSILREKAGFKVKDLGAPLDVFWFRLPYQSDKKPETTGRFAAGGIMIRIYRGDYWQCAFVIAKDSADVVRQQGLDAFKAQIARLAPDLADQTDVLTSWEDIKLLTVRVDRLERWHADGLLCIGDAAHAMSPIGGVGVNLAVQDAVAAANTLWRPLREGRISESDLARVQKRRLWPTKATQFVQVQAQNRLIAPTLNAEAPFRAPWLLRHLKDIPILRDLPAQAVGVGVRAEHIRSPELPPS